MTTLSLVQMRATIPQYKIQTKTLWGWADLKTSTTEDGVENYDYEVETFDSKEDAENEIQDIVDSLNDDAQLYRVVDADVEQDVDIYS